MKKNRLSLFVLAAMAAVMSLTSCGSDGYEAPEVIDEPATTEEIAPENPAPEPEPEPEPEPQPEPEPEEPVDCSANDECASNKCSAETGVCVASCPMGTIWKTPAGEVTGGCEEFTFTIPVPPPPPPPVDEWM